MKNGETSETEAQRARARLAAIVESSDDAIISKDLNGVIATWNAGAERTFGYTAEEAIGRSVTMLMPPDRIDEEPAILDRVRRGERIAHYETVRRRKDGTLIDISLSVSPIVDGHGVVIGASKIARDVTAQKRVAARAARDHEMTARLYEIGRRCARSGVALEECLEEVLDAALWVAGSSRGFIHLLDERTGTLTIAVQRGFASPFLEHFSSVAANVADSCASALTAGERVVVEDVPRSPLFHGTSSLRVLLDAGVLAVQSTPLVSTTGAVLGVVSTHFSEPRRLTEHECQLLDLLARQGADFIERRRGEQQRDQLFQLAQSAREEAEAANRAKDEFLAMLGHELRNPLSAVRNAVAVALLDNANRGHALEIARRQIDQLGRLVDDLLDVARITQGRVPLRKVRVDLSDILQRSIEAARPALEERGHTVSVSIVDPNVHLNADPARLEQAVGNILANAAKYTDPGGTVTLVARRERAEVVIRVSDTGIGIAPELLPRIFDLFAQGERSLDRSQGGLGIGLTLVRRIVELHGGTVEAHSAGVGAGASFIVRLPAIPDSTGGTAYRAGAAEIASEQRLEHAPARVLMVEDNADAAESLVMILELLGHHVRVVHDGIAALKAARANPPDVMLVDIGLPGMNGYEVAHAIREDPGLKRVVLVALTGYGRPEDKSQAIEAGFDYHLVKPVDLDALGDVVGRATRSGTPAERSTDTLVRH